MNFNELHLAEPLLRAVAAEGYDTPTPIQQQAIPALLQGKDLLGIAQTGTGKTAAFTLPILHHLHEANVSLKNGIHTLILAPTRELAIQIDESIGAYGRETRVRHTVIYGGVSQGKQVSELQRGVHILVATPGRLLDLMQQGYVHLNNIKVLVLDEADRMLDMGFIRDIRRIMTKVPSNRQTMLFSATMPHEIAELAQDYLRSPVRVEVKPVATTADLVEQYVYHVDAKAKTDFLIHLLADPALDKLIVFTRTKHGADKVVKKLNRMSIQAEAIHGNKSQNHRQKTLAGMKNGDLRVLVATDLAARGIDVEGITHVINFDIPNEPETYVHRIGRTARAGNSGIAIAFCDREETAWLRGIQRLIRQDIKVLPLPAFTMHNLPDPPRPPRPEPRSRNNAPRNQQGGSKPAENKGGGEKKPAPKQNGFFRRGKSSLAGNNPPRSQNY